MRRLALMSSKHRWKALVAVPLGLIIGLGSALAVYFTYGPEEHQQKWALLMLTAWPITLWGCHHLARYKGYHSTVIYFIFAVGLFSGVLVGAMEGQLVLTVWFTLFLSILFPSAILFMLPDKHHSHHHRRRRGNHPVLNVKR